MNVSITFYNLLCIEQAELIQTLKLSNHTPSVTIMIMDVAWYQINYIILLYPLRLLYCISFILHPSVEELNELHKKIMAATDEAKVGDYMKLQDYRIMVDLLALKIFLRESCFAWPTEQDPTHTQPKIHQSKIRKCFDQAMDIPLDIIITSCDTS